MAQLMLHSPCIHLSPRHQSFLAGLWVNRDIYGIGIQLTDNIQKRKKSEVEAAVMAVLSGEGGQNM